MILVIEIPENEYKKTLEGEFDITTFNEAVKNGTPFKDCDKWKQLRETVSEIRDNNEFEGNGATEICKFLLNYMEILENEADN